MPALKGLDMAKEKREWEKSSTLRRMLRLARFPENDSVEAALYRRYRDLGGRASDLKSYTEFASSRFVSLLPD